MVVGADLEREEAMSIECPECGEMVSKALLGRRGDIGPGEWCLYQCPDAACRHEWWAIMPEPPDGYAGDGVFAENH